MTLIWNKLIQVHTNHSKTSINLSLWIKLKRLMNGMQLVLQKWCWMNANCSSDFSQWITISSSIEVIFSVILSTDLKKYLRK